MLLSTLLIAASSACTLDTSGQIVGFDPEGTRALVRIERHVNDDDLAIDLVLLDLTSGATAERYVILAFDDDRDATLRATRWKAAEAEVTALGVAIDPTLTPHASLGPSGAVAIPETQAVVELGERPASAVPGHEALVASVFHGQQVVDRVELGLWPPQSSSNAVTYPEALWTTPAPGTVVVQTYQGCSDPGFHVVHVPTEPASTPPPTVWCGQRLRSDLPRLRCRDASVTTLPSAELPAVTKVDLRDSGVNDLHRLASLPAVEVLDLEDTPVTSLAPLAGHPSLRRLDLTGVAVADLSPLAKMAALERVTIDAARHAEVQAVRDDLDLRD